MITNKSNNLSEINFLEGEVLLIDKETGWTSFDVVAKTRRLVKVKKVGHAGTLDPAATGLLICCTGKMTKQINNFQGLDKTYTGVITLGKTTPSMDSETEYDSEFGIEGITEENVLSIREKFLGNIKQVPPMYSALKHKGKALYKYARKGESVKREPRNITIFEFEISKVELPDVYFKIRCSKGTYIRVIAHDFGNELGCGGYLKSLRRTHIGNYSVMDALSISELNELLSKNSSEVK